MLNSKEKQIPRGKTELKFTLSKKSINAEFDEKESTPDASGFSFVGRHSSFTRSDVQQLT